MDVFVTQQDPCFHLRIKVMADYGASGLWCEDCGMLDHDDLGLPTELSNGLRHWVATYDGLIDEWLKSQEESSEAPTFVKPPLAAPEAVNAFNDEGFALARAIKDYVRDTGRAVYYWIE